MGKRKKIKNKTEIIAIAIWKEIEKSNKTTSCFSEKIDKIDTCLCPLAKKKEGRHTLPISEMKEVSSHGHEKDKRQTVNNSMPTYLIT